ncbi:MAG: hypothetical protein ACFFCS_14065 [Candidatus Hodarchaeota archaeon]
MSKAERKLKSGKKVSLLIMAFGMIIGGCLAIAIEPVPPFGFGWALDEDDVYNSWATQFVFIEDVDGDGAMDIFFWTNPMDKEQPYPDEMSDAVGILDKTLQLNIISGRNGSLIKKRNVEGSEQWVSLLYEDQFVCTSDNDVIALVAKANDTEPSNWEADYIPKWELFDPYSWSLIRIDMPSLEIVDTINLIDEGWEDVSGIIDKGNRLYWEYYVDIAFINNEEGLQVGNSSYYGDFLVWKSWFFNDSQKMFLINPSTFELIDEVNWDFSGPLGDAEPYLGQPGEYAVWDWVSGPTRTAQKNWRYPYFCALYDYNTSISDIKSTNLYMTTVDKLGDNTSTQWDLVNNQTIWDYNETMPPPGFNPLSNINAEFYLSLNGTGNGAGITVYRREIGLAYLNNQSTLLTPEFFPWYGEGGGSFVLGYMQLFAFQLASLNFDYNPSNNGTLTFSCEGVTEWYMSNSTNTPYNGINTTWDYGGCMGLVPVKTNTSNQNETSMALVFSNQETHWETIDNQNYPFINYSVFFLPGNYSGVVPNTTVTSLADLTPFNITVTAHSDTVGFIPPNYPISIDFDVDGDNKTDIPFFGTNYNKSAIVNKITPEEMVSGLMAAVTQKGDVNQQAWLRLGDFHHAGEFVEDLNGDGISDVFWLSQFTFLYNKPEAVVGDVFTRRLADPLTSVLTILGFISVALGIVCIIGSLGIRKASIKIQVKSKARPFLLGIIAIAAFGVMYWEINQMVVAIQQGQDMGFGMSDIDAALANLQQWSNVAIALLTITLPVTAGLYTILAPRVSSIIIRLNRWRMKKKPKKDRPSDSLHEILIIPPFGRSTNMGQVRNRLLVMITMSITIGLTVFDYGTRWFDFIGISEITIIKGLLDEALLQYLTGIFLYMVIPSMVAMSLFFWLLPPAWLLDDAGVLYYIKDKKSTIPEDIETVSSWFSDKIVGFFGIGAILSYAFFVLDSPVIYSYTNLPGEIQIPFLVFVFGFIIVTSFCMAVLAVIMHDAFAPYNASKLYNILSKKGFDVRRTEIQFVKREELTPETSEAGFLGKRVTESVQTSDEPSVID